MTNLLFLEEILALDLITLYDHKMAIGHSLDPVGHRAALEEVLPKSEIFAVLREGQLVAYTSLREQTDGLWFVGGFGIHPDHRNAGVTKELIVGIAAIVRRAGAEILQSHVFRANKLSMAFHRRLGFKIIQENTYGVAFQLDVRMLAANPLIVKIVPALSGDDI